MKSKKIGMLIVGLMFALLSQVKAATVYTLVVNWSFDENAVVGKEVSDYNLYREGVLVATFPGGTTKSGQFVLALEPQVSNFTLTAEYSDGTESPHSAPYPFNPMLDSKPVTPQQFKLVAGILGKNLMKPNMEVRSALIGG